MSENVADRKSKRGVPDLRGNPELRLKQAEGMRRYQETLKKDKRLIALACDVLGCEHTPEALLEAVLKLKEKGNALERISA